MFKLIVSTLILLISFSLGVAIYFFLKIQALNQQLAIEHAAQNHVINMNLMNLVAIKFNNTFDIWEIVLLISSAILIIVLNFVFKSK